LKKMSNAKIIEAEANIKQAEKYLKTSLFKWDPDYDSAGDAYSRAATAYKVGGNKQKAIECLDKACDCYKQMRTLFQAARVLDQAVLLARDLNDFDAVVSYAERGALLFRQDGSNESAAQLLEKAAKIVVATDPEKAIGIYFKAADTVGLEDEPRKAIDHMAMAARLQVRCKKYDESVVTLNKVLHIMSSLDGYAAVAGRNAAGLVMVHLMLEDHIAAMKAFEMYGAYCDMETQRALGSLLDAFDEQDGDAAKEAVNSKALKDLDIDFARLTKQIVLPDSAGLEEAAAKLGAERAAVAKKEKEKAEAIKSATETTTASSADTPKEVIEQQKALEADGDGSDDDDELC